MVRRCAIVASVAVAAALGVGAGPASGSTPHLTGAAEPMPLFDLAGPAKAGRTPARSHTARLPRGRSLRVTIPVSGTDRRTSTLYAADQVGSYDSWRGVLDGDARSLVSVVRGPKGESSAYVSTAEGAFVLRQDGVGYAWRPAKAALPEGRDALVPPGATLGSSTGSAPAATAGGAAAGDATNRRIDIVVGWTTAAQTEAGGDSQIRTLAAQSVATSNAAYASSGVSLRLNLAGTALATGAQGTDAELILNRLRAGSDGYFDNLASLRESTGADLVSLLTDSNIGYCGIAFYPLAGGGYGQSVIAQSCAVDNLSFPHEVGHNLGAAHDRYVDVSGYYSYGFGYVNLAQRWRTIMAYNNQCADSGFDCTRIARFSGPSVVWNGLPAGNTATDNARALNTTAAMVAGYRTPSKREVAVRVAGRGGVSAGATAAYLNVTVTGATASGFVTVYPCGTTRPSTSTINFTAGRTVANAAIVRLGTGSSAGEVCYYSSAPVDVIIDVTGQAGGAATAGYLPASPFRVLDTRSDGGAIAAGATRALTVTGAAGGNRVPAGSPGAVLNVTSTNAAGGGFLTVYPCGTTRPTASTLNMRTAGPIANSTTVALTTSGADAGRVCVYASTSTHLVIDIQGAVVATGGQKLNTLAGPSRLIDTRAGSALSTGVTRRLQVTGAAGVPSGARAAAANVTVVGPTGSGFLTAWPCGARPTASNLNFLASEVIAGAVSPALDGSGGMCLQASRSTDAVVDIAGYYASTGSGIGTLTPYRLYDSRYL